MLGRRRAAGEAAGRREDGRAKIHIAYKFAPPARSPSGITDHKTFEILGGETPIREALEKI